MNTTRITTEYTTAIIKRAIELRKKQLSYRKIAEIMTQELNLKINYSHLRLLLVKRGEKKIITFKKWKNEK